MIVFIFFIFIVLILVYFIVFNEYVFAYWFVKNYLAISFSAYCGFVKPLINLYATYTYTYKLHIPDF